MKNKTQGAEIKHTKNHEQITHIEYIGKEMHKALPENFEHLLLLIVVQRKESERKRGKK